MDDDKKELDNGFEFLTSLELVDSMPNASLPTARKLDVVRGTSHIQIFLDVITNNGFRRPPADVLHRQHELTEIVLM